eukprot:TRINITY_DN5441_c0_g1_i1.p1 TRINITY_DN5441_c0_g1~~TRINITY_DN5441_c0_g1_i1.p1  ORF type:complete len:657 (+),score=105.11 TRINITY_DN5441_c0_g1_i1:70-1971(+)
MTAALFLDIDGVVVPVPSFGMGGGDLDATCLCNLKSITTAHPDLRIVVSSTWRNRPEDMARLNEALGELGLPPAKDVTPKNARVQSAVSYLEDDPDEQMLVRDRVDEICEWLQDHAPVAKWLALDDMDLGLDPRMAGHFVLTSKEWGLQANNAEDALHLLNIQAQRDARRATVQSLAGFRFGAPDSNSEGSEMSHEGSAEGSDNDNLMDDEEDELPDETPQPVVSPVNPPPAAVVETSSVRKTEDNDGNKSINQYALGETLGKGAYSKVKLAYNKAQDRYYAVKVMNKSLLRRMLKGSRSALADVQREVAIMKKLRHPNLVSLYEVIDDPQGDKLYLILDFVEKGPIRTVKENRLVGEPLTEDESCRFVRHLLCGLSYLHRQHIIHRDIKPENLLLSADNVLRIADFGTSCYGTVEGELLMNTMAGTPAFMSPEALVSDKIDGKAVDIWAVGVTMFVLVFGTLPFPGRNFIEVHKVVQNTPTPIPADCPEAARNFFERILDKNPTSRITMNDLADHPFVTKGGMYDALPRDHSTIITLTDQDVLQAITTGENINPTTSKGVCRAAVKVKQTRKQKPRSSSVSTEQNMDQLLSPEYLRAAAQCRALEGRVRLLRRSYTTATQHALALAHEILAA